jgi:hypothetical protein
VKDEYRQLATSVRKCAGHEDNAMMRAQWKILAGTYVLTESIGKAEEDQ